jgi:hypothetical protein
MLTLGQVNDGAVTRRDKINDLAHSGHVLVRGNDEGARRYLGRVIGPGSPFRAAR